MIFIFNYLYPLEGFKKHLREVKLLVDTKEKDQNLLIRCSDDAGSFLISTSNEKLKVTPMEFNFEYSGNFTVHYNESLEYIIEELSYLSFGLYVKFVPVMDMQGKVRSIRASIINDSDY